ncbi:hypothetical protein [Methylobacterium nodulans]|uniref:Uncharacterized protein n=1 Tax=Methylobacterium nodulans (strain LMG 21967 / CNCM I-2342 / ORS 2060) TaxID=460265 RepID=B8IHQ3_METNO|nr:hypothetical protein [Methylobacterium nodulans]ACL61716.1 hypothetical protein Mnod_6974 [Methylobacterium nodulans ORS 2060]
MRALPITITANDSGHFNLTVGHGENTQHATGLAWDELLGMVGVLTHPEIRSAPYGISKVRAVGAPEPDAPAPCVPRHQEPAPPPLPEPMAVIRIPLDQANQLSSGMADLLCWLGGFRAALHNDALDRLPMGIDQTREARRLIRAAISDATGDDFAELPF